MKKATPLLTKIFLPLGLVLVLSACLTDHASNPSDAVRLGALFSLSGIKADLGTPSSKGAQLAVDQLNSNGGLLGRSVELLLKDVESDTAVTKEKVAEVLKEAPDMTAFFGLSDTDLALAAAQEAKRGNRLFLTSGATSPLLPAQVPGYLYLACFGDNVQAAAAAEWAYNERKARTVTVLYDSLETYTVLLQRYFIDRFQSLGGKVLAAEGYDPLNIAVGRGLPTADLVFLSAGSVEDAIVAARQLRQAGVVAPIVGGDSFDAGPVWATHPDITDVYYTTHAYLGADNPDPLVKKFREAYTGAYGTSTPGAFAALGYDAVNLLAAAITEAGSTDPDAVRKALAGIDKFQGVTGTISFAGGRPIPRKSVSIIAVKNGATSLAQQLTPSVVPNP